MDHFWGVDSVNAANSPARYVSPSAPPQQTLYDLVVNWATAFSGGRPTRPAFWGRYINQSRRNRLQPGEVEYLFARGCRIALVYNDLHNNLTGHADGKRHGELACALARETFHVGPGVRIYADLENWRVTPDWILGWWEAMYQSEYAGMGGLYGRGAELANPFRWGTPRHPASFWSRSAQLAGDRQQDEAFDDLVGQLATGQLGKTGTPYVWSNMPRSGGDPRAGQSLTPPTFAAVAPGGTLIETAVWQYRLMCPLGTTHRDTGVIDMNVATARGFSDMWSAM